MAAKWASPEDEFTQSQDKPTLRDLSAKWKIPYSTLSKQAATGHWTEKRQTFGKQLETKTDEKTVEKVAERVSDDKAELIARQVKNLRGFQSIGVALGAKLQAAVAQFGPALENDAEIMCAPCGFPTAVKCVRCGTVHRATPLRPDQAAKIFKDVSQVAVGLSKEERSALGLGDDDKPAVQVNVLVNPQWIQIRTMLMRELAPYPDLRVTIAARLQELGAGDATP